jgi:hypothetical protein
VLAPVLLSDVVPYLNCVITFVGTVVDSSKRALSDFMLQNDFCLELELQLNGKVAPKRNHHTCEGI